MVAERVAADLSSAVAIVAVAGRFPGAADVERFWANLCAGVESISRFDAAEAVARGVDPAVARRPRFVGAEGLLDGVDRFDAAFFGYSPGEAALMDPQHRICLEVAWEAFDRAGYDPRCAPGPVGVYLSASMSSYLVRNLLPDDDLVALHGGFGLLIHNDKDFLPTTVSHKLGLTGPSLAVGSACSSSLVAVHLACQGLLAGECTMALAGGVSLQVPQGQGYVRGEDSIYSADGRCRPFDALASGTVGGSGAGVVLLKRWEDARRDGDHVHALVLGSAVNNDGERKAGYTAPGVDGQCAVVAEALAVAGVSPGTVGYVEAHGTGTPLGDPVEVAALARVFAPGNGAPCLLGSVKSNIGHLDAAAGVAGLVKAALAVERGTIPATLHFRAPNPAIDLAATPFHVAARTQPWPDDGRPRVAGVSAFGIGGTNAHVVLGGAPAAGKAAGDAGWHPLTVSARSRTALDHQLRRVAAHLRAGGTGVPAASRTLTGRRDFAHRAAVVARDPEEAAAALEAACGQAPAAPQVAHGAATPGVLVVLPGQGTEHPAMALDLWRSCAPFREHLDACREVLRDLDVDVDVLLDAHAVARGAAGAWLEEPVNAVPALFAVQYAMASTLAGCGLGPSLVLGHSLGELTAATLAGVVNLVDAATLAVARGRLQQAMPAGALLAVALGEPAVRARLVQPLRLAAVNASDQCVVAGSREDVARFEAELRADGVAARLLTSSRAHHSDHATAVAEGLRPVLEAVTLHEPSVPLVSTVTGAPVAPGEVARPDYWLRQVVAPVRFHEAAARALATLGAGVVLEVTPRSTLAALLRRHPSRRPDQTVVASQPSRAGTSGGARALTGAVARAWVAGRTVDWGQLGGGPEPGAPRRAPLPAYPFERERHWVDPPRRDAGAGDGLPGRARLAAWLPALTAGLDARPGSPPGLDAALDRLCASLAQEYFASRGCAPGTAWAPEELRERLAVLPAFAPFVDYLLSVLVEEGAVRRGSSVEFVAGADLPPSEDLAGAAAAAYPEAAGLVDLLVGCAAQYPQALSEPGSALAVLYPGGRGDRLARAFDGAPDQHGVGPLLDVVARLRDRLLDGGRVPLRVLEVGAGGGRLTWELAGVAGGAVDYLATDVGPLFCAHLAEEAARRGLACVRTAVLDISRDPGPQGVGGPFDLVVGLDVVHATPDVEATMRRLLSLLAPGGLLAVVETTARSRWLTFVWGLSEGWWAFDDGVREGTPLLDAGRWREVVQRLGAAATAVVPDDAGATAALVLAEARTGSGAAAADAPPEAKRDDPSTWGWRPGWRRARPLATGDDRGGRRCLVLSGGPTGEAVAAALRSRGSDVTLAGTGAPLALPPGPPPDTVVHAVCADLPAGDCAPAALQDTLEAAFHGLLDVARALGERGPGQDVRLLAVTRGAVDVLGDDLLAPGQVTAHAAVAVIAQEYPWVSCRAVDLEPGAGPGAARDEGERLAEELADCDPAPVVAHRGRRRWTPTYDPAPLPPRAARPRRLRPGGTYLVTGGLGGIGSSLAAHLAGLPADVVVVSRRRLPGREAWPDWLRAHPSDLAAPAVRRFLDAEAAGGSVTVESADVRDAGALHAIVRRATGRLGPLTGVVHAAGVVDTGGMIQRRTRAASEAAMAARTAGTLALEQALSGQEPEFVLLCSSIGSALPKLKFGEVAYLASHQFLNAYADHAAASGRPVVAVAWTDWVETGMWSQAQRRLRERYDVARAGPGTQPGADLLAGITTAEAVEVFDRVVEGGLTGQVVVSTQDLSAVLRRHESFGAPEHRAMVESLRLASGDRQRPHLPTPHAAPEGPTERTVATLWARLLGVRDLGRDDDFFALGGDSLLALRFLGHLREETGVDHPVAAFFAQPSVRAVAAAVDAAAHVEGAVR